MKRIALLSCIALTLAAATPAALGAAAPRPVPRATTETIEGLVRDVACPIRNHASTAVNFNLACALACARTGSPLVILTRDGTMYFPITDTMPDPDQHKRLMPFVGKFVRATGTVYESKGTRAIVIREIHVEKSVPVTANAFPKAFPVQ